MQRLIAEHDFKKKQKLSFCYLCGKQIGNELKDVDRDHVPPNSVFNKKDRTPPLILPTHQSCNEANSGYDEQIGQLVSVLHRADLKPKDINRLQFVLLESATGTDPHVLIKEINLALIIERWVRAFHVSLYEEYLPNGLNGKFYGPVPGTDSLKPIPRNEPDRKIIVRVIKNNRAANNVDRISCRNKKCIYECVWLRTDKSRPVCFFALDVYGWAQLGDPRIGPAQSCVGAYFHESVPSGASLTTKLIVPFTNTYPFNAFAN